MTAHIPTMLLAIIVVGSVLSLSVGAFATRSLRDGMMYWTAGLFMHTLSYIVFSQRDAFGDFSAFILANVLRAGAWALVAEGLCEFYRRIPLRTLIWAPVAAVFLAAVFLFDNEALRIVTVSLIFAAQSLLSFSLIWRERRKTQGRGQYFLMIGLIIATSLLLLRAAATALGSPVGMLSLTTQSSPIQTLSFLGALISLLLLSLGFVLISKDRADTTNRILSTRDELTGLANRRHMNKVLADEWTRSRRSEQPLTLVMIDVDQFKLYNDHYGHQAGDVCLWRVAQAIQSGAGRAGDLAARYGGEEFLLILPDTDAAAGRYLAEGVRKSVESLNLPHVYSPTGKITISVGVAAFSEGFYENAEGLLRAADEALYQAKNGGRNQVQIASEPSQPGPLAQNSTVKLVQLIWRSAYESGHPVIDAQHRALFTEANKLLSAVLGGRQKAEVAKLVDGLIADIARHFLDEEAIIAQSGYAGAAHHAGLHRALMEKSATLADHFQAGTLSLGELFEFLAHEVVARHMLIEDRDYFSFLASKVEAQPGTALRVDRPEFQGAVD